MIRDSLMMFCGKYYSQEHGSEINFVTYKWDGRSSYKCEERQHFRVVAIGLHDD